jgi:hypothetical protein
LNGAETGNPVEISGSYHKEDDPQCVLPRSATDFIAGTIAPELVLQVNMRSPLPAAAG